MKNCTWYIIIVVVLIVGYLIGVFFPLCLRPQVLSEPITKGEYINVFVNVVVAITSVLAILVALFKESILRRLNHPVMDVQLLEEGIVENIDREQQNPKTDSYECLIEINNIGNITAEAVDVVVEEVRYSKKDKTDLKQLRGVTGSKKLMWDSSSEELLPLIPKEVKLFTIVSPDNFGTPAKTDKEELRIKFNGIDLHLRQSQKGYWKVKYYIKHKNGKSVHFSLFVDWDGSWKNRKTEMKDVLKVRLEK